MKSNFISSQHSNKPEFKDISFLTFIVYLICSSFGWLNWFLASYCGKIYYPVRSYTILFDKSNIKNLTAASTNIYNLVGFKSLIHTSIPYKLINDLFFIFLSLSLISLFYYGYKSLESSKVDNLEIAKWSVFFSILMALTIPAHSADLYGYIARGAQQVFHNQNPYITSVSEIKNYSQDYWFFNFMWPLQPTTYGPLFIYLSKLLVYLSNNNFIFSILNFKILNLTVFLLFLMFLINKTNTRDFYLIAFNPLIMIQGLWNCHNDLITGILIFTGLYSVLNLQKKTNIFWGAFSLAVGIGIKYTPVIIIPFLITQFKKKKGIIINLFLGLLAGGVLVGTFSLDYFSSFSSIDPTNKEKLITNIDLVHKSLIATIFAIFKYLFHFTNLDIDLSAFLTGLKYIVYGAFSIFYLYNGFLSKSSLIFKITSVLFIFFSFVLAKFHSWYLLNIIFLIPLLKESESMKMLKVLLVTLSLTHIFSMTFLDQAKILNFVCMTLIPVLLILKRKPLLKDF